MPDSPPKSLLNLSDGEYDPSTIGALGTLGQLQCLNLSGCLQNYYDQGNEIGAKNVEALLVMAEGLKQLAQLDLSRHFDSFYATVEDEDEHCPYDLIGKAVGKMSKLQLLMLQVQKASTLIVGPSIRLVYTCIKSICYEYEVGGKFVLST